jgi:hypothetical protein
MRKGINIYNEAHHFFGELDESTKLENFSGSGKPPCVFLSHRSSDKSAVKAIGKYITDAGINIYMDIDDEDLQAAVKSNDHTAITLFIERGINASTDLMACISNETLHSCWVPYEIGFGKRANKYLGCLRLNDTPKLPSYLSIVHRLNGIEDLNGYLKNVKKRKNGLHSFSGTLDYVRELTEAAEIDSVLPSFSSYHTLRNYLDR